MSRATINPLILIWARERSSLNQSELAKKIGVNEDLLRKIEDGKEFPTLRQAQFLANVLHIPFGYLFLSEIPKTISPIADFRTVPEKQKGHFSIGLEETINDALRKRDWLHDWRIQEGWEPNEFIGKYNISNEPKDIAVDIREKLKLEKIPGKKFRTWEDHLKSFVSKTEEAGIIVLQNSIVINDTHRHLSVNEFRGFTIIDNYAPVIFINTSDSISGRIFTLGHELAHIWIGSGGISNPSPSEALNLSRIEKFCNLVSAELLIPTDEFREIWKNIRTKDIFEKSQEIAELFKVSVFSILIREYEQQLISRDIFYSLYQIAESKIEPIMQNSEAKGTFYNTWRVRNSRVFVQEVLSALRQGDVMYREAAQILNVHPKTLDGVMQRF